MGKPTKKDPEPTAGRHGISGWPHLSTAKGTCLCTSGCCQSKNGCVCHACSGHGHENCPGGQRRAERARREALMDSDNLG